MLPLCFGNISKFPVFSLAGIYFVHFPCVLIHCCTQRTDLLPAFPLTLHTDLILDLLTDLPPAHPLAFPPALLTDLLTYLPVAAPDIASCSEVTSPTLTRVVWGFPLNDTLKGLHGQAGP